MNMKKALHELQATGRRHVIILLEKRSSCTEAQLKKYVDGLDVLEVIVVFVVSTKSRDKAVSKMRKLGREPAESTCCQDGEKSHTILATTSSNAFQERLVLTSAYFLESIAAYFSVLTEKIDISEYAILHVAQSGEVTDFLLPLFGGLDKVRGVIEELAIKRFDSVIWTEAIAKAKRKLMKYFNLTRAAILGPNNRIDKIPYTVQKQPGSWAAGKMIGPLVADATKPVSILAFCGATFKDEIESTGPYLRDANFSYGPFTCATRMLARVKEETANPNCKLIVCVLATHGNNAKYERSNESGQSYEYSMMKDCRTENCLCGGKNAIFLKDLQPGLDGMCAKKPLVLLSLACRNGSDSTTKCPTFQKTPIVFGNVDNQFFVFDAYTEPIHYVEVIKAIINNRWLKDGLKDINGMRNEAYLKGTERREMVAQVVYPLQDDYKRVKIGK